MTALCLSALSAAAQYKAPAFKPSDITKTITSDLPHENPLVESAASNRQADSVAARGLAHSTAKRHLPKGHDLKTNLVIDDGTRILGGVTSWGGGDFVGLASIRPVDGTYPELISRDAPCSSAATFDGRYYYSKSYATAGGQVYKCTYNVFDTKENKLAKTVKMDPQYYNVTQLMAYNPQDKKIWGVGCDGLGRPFIVNINTETGANQYMTQTMFTGNLRCMAFSASGMMYGLNKTGELVTVNLTTGEVTKVGTVEPKGLNYDASLAFDYHTGKLYCTAMTDNFANTLWLVDPKTAKRTKVSTLPDYFSFNGSYVVSPTAEPKAPATVSALSVAFGDKGSFKGTVSATAPTTCFDGTGLTGTLTMKIYVDSVLVGTRQQAPGTTVNLSHDFKTRGEHWLQVVYANAAGESPRGTIKPFCGLDVPDDAHHLKLTVDDQTGKVTLSWDAVKKGIHEGYLNADKVTYNVVRMPDDTVVASQLRDTTFTETLPNDAATQRYHYEVWATADGVDADKVASNSVVYGKPLSVPVKEQLGSDSFGPLLTTENRDGHGDGFYNGWGVEFVSTGYSDSSYVSDKWAYTPAIHLKKGRYYYHVQHDGQDYELTYGKHRTPKSQLANKIGAIAAQPGPDDHLTADDNQMNASGHFSFITYKKLIDIKEDGNYYFGFHYVAPYTGGQLGLLGRLRLFELRQGPAVDAPMACEVDTAFTQPKGELNNNIRFTAPTSNLLGQSLQKLDKVEFYLAMDTTNTLGGKTSTNKLVYTLNSIEPGKQYTATVPAHQGKNLYYFYAYDDKGMGDEAEVTVWAGIDYPQTVSNPTFKVIDNKDIIMKWDSPSEVGQNGGYVPANDLTYYPGVAVAVANGLVDLNKGQKERTYTFVGDTGEQYRYYYGVTPENSLGRGQGILTAIPIGTPYKAPFTESFTFGSGSFQSKVWSLLLMGGEHSWTARSVATDGSFKPADDDGGMLTFSHDTDTLSREILVTPLMEITGMKKPVLSFYFHHNSQCDDHQAGITVYPVVNDELQPALASIGLNGGQGESGWKHYELPLDKYASEKRVYFYFLASSHKATSILGLDKMELYDNVPLDLAVESVDAPAKVMPNEDNTFKVVARNHGRDTLSNYAVGLYADGKLVAKANGEDLAFNREKELNINFVPAPAFYGKSVVFTVKAMLDGDANDENDSINTEVKVNNTALPAPTSLALNGKQLTWIAPVVPHWQSVREDFEPYEPFIINNIGEWTVYDRDQQLSQAPNSGNGTAAEFGNNWCAKGFQVWNPSGLQMVSQLQGNTMKIYGKNCLVSFDATGYYPSLTAAPKAQTDDWLVSPRVAGGTKMKFVAKQVPNTVNEKFQVLVSYGTAKLEDFGLLAEDSLQGTGINKFEYELPADAHYFAIRNITENGFALMIDNIDYTPGFTDLELLGYNVYKDGVKLNDAPVETATYALDTTDGSEYGVTAVYDYDGESAMATLNVANGIQGIGTGACSVSANGESLTFTHAEGKAVRVFDTLGQLLYAGIIKEDSFTLPLKTGVYMVQMDGKTMKIANK